MTNRAVCKITFLELALVARATGAKIRLKRQSFASFVQCNDFVVSCLRAQIHFVLLFVSEVFFGLENSHRLLNDDSFTAPPAAGHVTESVNADRRHPAAPQQIARTAGIDVLPRQ